MLNYCGHIISRADLLRLSAKTMTGAKVIFFCVKLVVMETDNLHGGRAKISRKCSVRIHLAVFGLDQVKKTAKTITTTSFEY